jgi:NAD(P)-dependent dehydrogenase (short-subunit alcohol dehydrogenase family)
MAEKSRPPSGEASTALVTGGGSGIGLAIAEALGRSGAQVCISGRAIDRLNDAQRKLANLGVEVSVLAFDVADREACSTAIADLIRKWGRIDALVNNAGVYRAGPFMSLPPQSFKDLFDTNVMGPVHLIQAVVPAMIDNGAGRIVNIASTAGKWGSENQASYNVSKHALVGLTRCLALEFARYGITVNAVCPGLVDTEMAVELMEGKARIARTSKDAILSGVVQKIPVGRLISPAEIANLVAYLLSPAAAGMTGQSIVYDGGSLQI